MLVPGRYSVNTKTYHEQGKAQQLRRHQAHSKSNTGRGDHQLALPTHLKTASGLQPDRYILRRPKDSTPSGADPFRCPDIHN